MVFLDCARLDEAEERYKGWKVVTRERFSLFEVCIISLTFCLMWQTLYRAYWNLKYAKIAYRPTIDMFDGKNVEWPSQYTTAPSLSEQSFSESHNLLNSRQYICQPYAISWCQAKCLSYQRHTRRKMRNIRNIVDFETREPKNKVRQYSKS